MLVRQICGQRFWTQNDKFYWKLCTRILLIFRFAVLCF